MFEGHRVHRKVAAVVVTCRFFSSGRLPQVVPECRRNCRSHFRCPNHGADPGAFTTWFFVPAHTGNSKRAASSLGPAPALRTSTDTRLLSRLADPCSTETRSLVSARPAGWVRRHVANPTRRGHDLGPHRRATAQPNAGLSMHPVRITRRASTVERWAILPARLFPRALSERSKQRGRCRWRRDVPRGRCRLRALRRANSVPHNAVRGLRGLSAGVSH